jgi:hypothetical protein
VSLAAAIAMISVTDASASTAYESPYTFEQTFGTALRLVRVDLGLKITEKDVDAGYVIFEYTSPESGKRVSSGSIELVKTKDGGVRVAVQLPAMPQYHEQMIVDALVKKLSAEHGTAPAKPKPAPPPVDDGGTGDNNKKNDKGDKSP